MEHAAPHIGDVVVFRPRRSYLVVIAPAVYLTMFGGQTLVQAAFHSNFDRTIGERAATALLFTVGPFAVQWFLYFRQPWKFRVSAAGLDLRTGPTDQPVHIPWSAITAIRLHRRWLERRLEVTIVPGIAGPDFDNRWKVASLGVPGQDGQLLVTAYVGAIQPDLFRLGIELAHHLSAETLAPQETNQRVNNRASGG
jgi:hypothetical protein